MKKNNFKFTDEYFEEHIITTKLGDGGQGIVYRTQDPDLVLKLVTDSEKKPITDVYEIKRHQEKFKLLKRLPIPQGIKIAKPIALLKDNPGYVMQLVRDMIPFDHFFPDKNIYKQITEKQIPSWLQNTFKTNPENAKDFVHYKNTGGLKRRLAALTQCASTLTQIHSAGLVYGDISPHNVFISSNVKHNQVWLIDADNLRFEKNKNAGSAWTPSYGAPELTQGIDIGRPRSDCHAFSVMAFYLLSLVHPFIGEAIEEDNEDWASVEGETELSNEEKAYQGLLPFIDDPSDDSNRCTTNQLPRALILTDELNKLFEKSFCEGRLDSWKRPAIYHWPTVLAKATDKVIECINCGMGSYIDSVQDNCEYCETKFPNKLVCHSHQWLGDGIQEPHWLWGICMNKQFNISLPERIFIPFDLKSHDNNCLNITFKQERFIITKAENTNIKLYYGLEETHDGNLQLFTSKLNLSINELEQGLWLYVDNQIPFAVQLILEN